MLQHEGALVSLVPGTAVAGTCGLCATATRSLSAAVLVQHEHGGSMRFEACERCSQALRRLAAAAGGRAQFAIAPEVGSAHRTEPPAARGEAATAAGAAVLIQERAEHVRDARDLAHRLRIYGQPRADGTWIGWVEFAPLDGGAPLRTGPETTQSSREQIAYWASGLEALYFEGAFRRARPARALA